MKRKPLDDYMIPAAIKSIEAAKRHVAMLALTGHGMSVYVGMDSKDCRVEISIYDLNETDYQATNFFAYLRNNLQLISLNERLTPNRRFQTEDTSKALRFFDAAIRILEDAPWFR